MGRYSFSFFPLFSSDCIFWRLLADKHFIHNFRYEHTMSENSVLYHEKPYYLVKVVNRKWAEKLLDGEVFMRAIACFGDISRRSEDANNQFRGDSLEGFSQSFENHHNPYAHTIDSTGKISEIVPNQVGVIGTNVQRENILSLCIRVANPFSPMKLFLALDSVVCSCLVQSRSLWL